MKTNGLVWAVSVQCPPPVVGPSYAHGWPVAPSQLLHAASISAECCWVLGRAHVLPLTFPPSTASAPPRPASIPAQEPRKGCSHAWGEGWCKNLVLGRGISGTLVRKARPTANFVARGWWSLRLLLHKSGTGTLCPDRRSACQVPTLQPTSGHVWSSCFNKSKLWEALRPGPAWSCSGTEQIPTELQSEASAHDPCRP